MLRPAGPQQQQVMQALPPFRGEEKARHWQALTASRRKQLQRRSPSEGSTGHAHKLQVQACHIGQPQTATHMGTHTIMYQIFIWHELIVSWCACKAVRVFPIHTQVQVRPVLPCFPDETAHLPAVAFCHITCSTQKNAGHCIVGKSPRSGRGEPPNPKVVRNTTAKPNPKPGSHCHAMRQCVVASASGGWNLPPGSEGPPTCKGVTRRTTAQGACTTETPCEPNMQGVQGGCKYGRGMKIQPQAKNTTVVRYQFTGCPCHQDTAAHRRADTQVCTLPATIRHTCDSPCPTRSSQAAQTHSIPAHMKGSFDDGPMRALHACACAPRGQRLPHASPHT